MTQLGVTQYWIYLSIIPAIPCYQTVAYMIWPLLPSDFQTVDTANVQTVHSLQLRASWSVRIVVIDRGGSKGVGGRGPNENYALCGPQIHNEACHLLQILVQRQMSKQRWWQLDNSALAPIRNVKQMSGEVQAYCPSRNYGTHCPTQKMQTPEPPLVIDDIIAKL